MSTEEILFYIYLCITFTDIFVFPFLAWLSGEDIRVKDILLIIGLSIVPILNLIVFIGIISTYFQETDALNKVLIKGRVQKPKERT